MHLLTSRDLPSTTAGKSPAWSGTSWLIGPLVVSCMTWKAGVGGPTADSSLLEALGRVLKQILVLEQDWVLDLGQVQTQP